MKEKMIQIPEELFWDSIKIAYLILNEDKRESLREDELIIVERFQNALETKLNKMVLHDLYTKSKTDLSEDERERARQEYLDRRGIHKDFRY